MIRLHKLKHGQRIQFAHNSYGQITNYEIDISENFASSNSPYLWNCVE